MSGKSNFETFPGQIFVNIAHKTKNRQISRPHWTAFNSKNSKKKNSAQTPSPAHTGDMRQGQKISKNYFSLKVA